MRLRPSPFAFAAVAGFAATAPAQLQCTQQSPATTGPATREFGFAYDGSRGASVMFAGNRGTGANSELWEWDGTDWSQLAAFPIPGPRLRPVLEPDPVNGGLLIFGGFSSGGVFLSDTWSYSGSFIQRAPSTSPPARSGHAMAHDPVTQEVFLFGGFVASGNDADDTWRWNGSTWSQIATANQPAPRGAHRMVYDGSRGQIVLFGGFQTPSQSTLGDTWQFDGSNWTTVATTFQPPSRCDQVMVYDSQRGQVLMFGGLLSFSQPGNTPVVTGDCWALDGNGWRQKTVSGLPSARSYAFGTYDSGNDQIVLHGGFDAATDFSDTYTAATTVPAAMVEYGVGCAGSAGVPALSADSLPWVDAYYQVSVGSVPNQSAGFMVLGLSDTVWMGAPIPVSLASLGLPGCDAWLSADFSALFLITNGVGSWGLTVCNCPWAVGTQYSLQAVVLDPGASNPLGASMSNALRATIGIW